MTWIAELCAKITQVAANPALGRPADVSQLVDRYNDAVDLVNARLRQAAVWLRAGLRMEAIGYIEEYPDARKSALLLELGDTWPSWAELAAQLDAGPVRAVDRDLVAEVDAGYDLYQAIRRVVDRYRRTCLIQGPTEERIALLRDLQRLDPENTIWREQRIALETVRIKAINRQAKQVAISGDRVRAEQLLDELSSDHWESGPPSKLVDSVSEIVQQMRTRESTHRFDEIAGQLHEAFGAFDERRIAELLNRWDGVASELGVEPDQHLVEDIDPIRAWHADQEEQRASQEHVELLTAQLTQSLDDQIPMLDLEQIYSELERREAVIPETLQRRYRSRQIEAHVVRRQRFRLLSLGVAATIVLSTAGLLWYVWSTSRSRNVEQLASELAAVLDVDQPDTDTATQLLGEAGRTKPWILVEPSIVVYRSRLDEIIERRHLTRGGFDAALARLERMTFDDPEVWEVLDRVEERAIELTARDRIAVEKQRDRIETQLDVYVESIALEHVRRRDQLESHARAAREFASGALGRVDRAAVLIEQMSPVRDGLKELLESATGDTDAAEYVTQRLNAAIAEVKKATKALLTQVDSEVRESGAFLDREGARDRAIARVRRTKGSTSALPSALKQYIDEFPEVSGASERYAEWFSIALTDASAWELVREWNDVASALQHPRVYKASDADRRRIVIDSLLDELPSHPNRAELAEYLDYLDKATGALGDDAALETKLASLQRALSRKWFTDLRCLRVPADVGIAVYYYTFLETGLRKFATTPDGMSISYELSSCVKHASELDQAVPRSKALVILPKAVPTALVPAPHVAAGEQMRNLIGDVDVERHWDRIFLELAIIVRDSSMDDILRVQLLSFLLGAHRDITWRPDAALNAFCDRVTTYTVNGLLFDELDWPSPTDPDVVRGREEARSLVSMLLPDLEGLIEQTAEQLENMVSLGAIEQIGLVWLDDHAQRVVVETQSRSGLFGVATGNGNLKIEPIGVDEQGVITSSDAPVPGTPVFRWAN